MWLGYRIVTQLLFAGIYLCSYISLQEVKRSVVRVQNSDSTAFRWYLSVLLRLVPTKLKLQPTGFRLVSDSKIGVNGIMLHQCNPIEFYQSEVSFKLV